MLFILVMHPDMERLVKYLAAGLLLLLSPFLAFAQADTIQILNKISMAGAPLLQEKIFFHTDKPNYFSGEIMWFKIYCVDGNFNRPLDVSKVAYAELLDSASKPVLQAKIALKQGGGSGSFSLPLNLPSGSYQLRGYTNWMKNFDPAFFFEKTITVINSLSPPETSPDRQTPKYDIQFFPEGGTLVEGIENLIGFRAVDRDGKGIHLEGVVVDENNRSLVRFTPLKFGIGNFLFTPREGHSYHAVIRPEGQEPVEKDLPKPQKNGYLLHLSDNGKDSIAVQIVSHFLPPAQVDPAVYLALHTKQDTKTIKKIDLKEGRATVRFSNVQFGEGITHLTLFSGNGEPVCERLYFGRPKRKLNLDAKNSKATISPREQVTIDLLTTLPGGAPTAADLSVSVYKCDSIQREDTSDIFSFLWLSSDLKGVVESPEYYFSGSGQEDSEAIDNLMLTHGWSRYRNDSLLSPHKKLIGFLPEYEGPIVTGRVREAKSDKPVPNVPCSLTFPGQKFRLYRTVSDSSGVLRFYANPIFQSGEMVVQTEPGIDSTLRLEIASPYSDTKIPFVGRKFRLSPAAQKDFLMHSIDVQVQHLYTAKANSHFKVLPTDSLAFFGLPDLKYYLDDYTRFGTMEEVLREYVMGISLHKKKNKFVLYLNDNRQHQSFEKEPLVLLDGLPVGDFNKIMEYDPLQIRKIEILNQKYLDGTAEFSGIISFTTYRGNFAGLTPEPNSLFVDFEGLQREREFFSPVYGTESQRLSRIPDFRNMLYWSPDIKTDAQGRGRIDFYTADRSGKYVVVIQGITKEGYSGSQRTFFLVSKPDYGMKQ